MRRVLLLSFVLAGCSGPTIEPPAALDRAAGGFRIHQSVIAVDGGRGRLIVIEVPRDATLDVVPATSPAALELIAAVPRDRACVAINGGFYDDGGAMGWVVHAGEESASLRPGGGSGVFLVDDDGPQIRHRDHVTARPREALQSIDRLVDAGRNLVGPNARPDPDARSAIALRRDGTLLLAVVFADAAVVRETHDRIELGSASSSTGLSLAAWADLLARPRDAGGLGALTALNLDGGYSTSLSIHTGDLHLDLVAHRATINALRACAR